MRKLSQNSELDIDIIHDIMSEQKPNQIIKFKISEKKLLKIKLVYDIVSDISRIMPL